MNTINMFAEIPDDDTLGGRLVRARDTMGMSPGDLAARVGVKLSTMQGWESDRAEPRANRLTMLAGILGVSVSWLLSGIGNAPQIEESSEELLDLKAQRNRLRDLHAETTAAIQSMDHAISQVALAAET